MPRPRHRQSFAEFFRRFIAAGSATLVFALGVFAASSELHSRLHSDAGIPADDGCAVVLFANGLSAPLATIAVAPPPAEWREQPRVQMAKIFLATPRYLRQPERGPPVG